MKHILHVFLFIVTSINAQNWSCFNSAYRYNYELDNAGIITNVLFADTVTVSGNDTVLATNRIVAECFNRCVTTTVSVPNGKRYFIKDMPQFLQRKVAVLANGFTHLYDTASLYIKNAGAVGSTWVFDSINSITATVAASGIKTIFGQNDSVRTILLNTVNTLLLSKNFGIIKYPLLYGKNKYYNLKGIERNHFYDQTALYGQKVINGWDIYNYQVGDVFCYRKLFSDYKDISGPITHYFYQQTTITSKSLTVSGYVYSADLFTYGYGYRWGTLAYRTDGYYSNNGAMNYQISNNANMPENSLYPGKLCEAGDGMGDYHFNLQPGAVNVGVLARDLSGSNYKCMGGLQGSNTAVSAPAGTVVGLNAFVTNPPINPKLLESNSMWHMSSVVFRDGFGAITFQATEFELDVLRDLQCFERNGISYYGPKMVGIEENAAQSSTALFPNPANSTLNITSSLPTSIYIYEIGGRKVKQQQCNASTQIDIGDLAAGLYFVEMVGDNGQQSTQKLIIEH